MLGTFRGGSVGGGCLTLGGFGCLSDVKSTSFSFASSSLWGSTSPPFFFFLGSRASSTNWAGVAGLLLRAFLAVSSFNAATSEARLSIGKRSQNIKVQPKA